jgi:hypothetical protein
MNSNKKKLGTLNLQLATTDAKIKIGKVGDKLNYDKCSITKEKNDLKLIEKKPNKEEIRYTGSVMAEQTSKYLIFKVNQDKTIDVIPADDWYHFKKDITYSTIQVEEVEENMKQGKGNILDVFLKNKAPATVAKKKEKKPKEEAEERVSGGGGGRGRATNNIAMEEDEDEMKYFKQKKEDVEEEDEMDVDKDLKEIPSDIEEGLKGKDKGVATKLSTRVNNFIESSEESDSDSFFGKKNNENSDIGEDEDDDDISLIDREYAGSEGDEQFLKQKRKADQPLDREGGSSSKVQRTELNLEESLNNLLTKHKKMSESLIVRELGKLGLGDLGSRLPKVLDKLCKRFQEGKEWIYFKKHD